MLHAPESVAESKSNLPSRKPEANFGFQESEGYFFSVSLTLRNMLAPDLMQSREIRETDVGYFLD